MGNKHSQSLMSAGSGETNGNGENPPSIKLEAMSIAARVKRGRGDEIRDALTQAQTEFFWYNGQGDSYKGVTSAAGTRIRSSVGRLRRETDDNNRELNENEDRSKRLDSRSPLTDQVRLLEAAHAFRRFGGR